MLHFKCGYKGCSEVGHFESDNRAETIRLQKKYGNGKYRCFRHSKPDEVLSEDNLHRETTYVVGKSAKYPHHNKLYFDGGRGVVTGPGFKAYASDFPAGTKVIVSVDVILP